MEICFSSVADSSGSHNRLRFQSFQFISIKFGERLQLQARQNLRKWTDRGRYPVSITFGEPLSNQTSAPRSDKWSKNSPPKAAKERTRSCLPMHRQFVPGTAGIRFAHASSTTSGTSAIWLWQGFCRRRRPRPMAATASPRSTDGRPVDACHSRSMHRQHRARAARQNTSELELHSRSRVRPVGDPSMRHQTGALFAEFLERVPLDPGPDVQFILGEDSRTKISNLAEFEHLLALCCCRVGCTTGSWAYAAISRATWRRSSFPAAAPANRKEWLSPIKMSRQISKSSRMRSITPQGSCARDFAFFSQFGYTVTLWGAMLAREP